MAGHHREGRQAGPLGRIVGEFGRQPNRGEPLGYVEHQGGDRGSGAAGA